MQEFENEINEAKRRVMEMNEKADRFSRKTLSKPPLNPPEKKNNDDSSMLLILAITVILAKENADNKILLALLYLLM